jgi:hypothetical protein
MSVSPEPQKPASAQPNRRNTGHGSTRRKRRRTAQGRVNSSSGSEHAGPVWAPGHSETGADRRHGAPTPRLRARTRGPMNPPYMVTAGVSPDQFTVPAALSSWVHVTSVWLGSRTRPDRFLSVWSSAVGHQGTRIPHVKQKGTGWSILPCRPSASISITASSCCVRSGQDLHTVNPKFWFVRLAPWPGSPSSIQWLTQTPQDVSMFLHAWTLCYMSCFIEPFTDTARRTVS